MNGMRARRGALSPGPCTGHGRFRTVRDRCLVEEQAARLEASKLTVEDLTGAVLELGELLAEQDDALVELAELIEEGV